MAAATGPPRINTKKISRSSVKWLGKPTKRRISQAPTKQAILLPHAIKKPTPTTPLVSVCPSAKATPIFSKVEPSSTPITSGFPQISKAAKEIPKGKNMPLTKPGGIASNNESQPLAKYTSVSKTIRKIRETSLWGEDKAMFKNRKNTCVNASWLFASDRFIQAIYAL